MVLDGKTGKDWYDEMATDKRVLPFLETKVVPPGKLGRKKWRAIFKSRTRASDSRSSVNVSLLAPASTALARGPPRNCG